MSETIKIHRTSDKKGSVNYTPISNSILQSKSLNPVEVAILIYLLSLPKNFTVFKKNVVSHFKGRVGRERIHKEWINLKDKGYIVKSFTDKRNLLTVRWDVYETPIVQDSKPQDIQIPAHIKSTSIEIKNIESTITNNTSIGIDEIEPSLTTDNEISNLEKLIIESAGMGEEFLATLIVEDKATLESILGKRKTNELEYHINEYKKLLISSYG